MSKLDSKQIMEITKIDPTDILSDGAGIVENTIDRLRKFPNEPFVTQEELETFHEIARLGEFARLKQSSFGITPMDLQPIAPLLSPTVMTMYGHTDFAMGDPSRRRKTTNAIDLIASAVKKSLKKPTKTEFDGALLSCAGALFSLTESVFEHTLHKLQRMPMFQRKESLIEKEEPEEFEGGMRMPTSGMKSEDELRVIAEDSYTFFEPLNILSEEEAAKDVAEKSSTEMFTVRAAAFIGRLTDLGQTCPKVFGTVIDNEFKAKYGSVVINDEDVAAKFEMNRKISKMFNEPYPTTVAEIKAEKQNIYKGMIDSDFETFYKNAVEEANSLFTAYHSPTAEEIRNLVYKPPTDDEDFSDVIF